MAKPGTPASCSKDEILDATLSIIDERGIEGFSVRSLAKHVGLSPMGIYTYFPSREDILKSLLDRFAQGSVASPVPGERWDDTIRRVSHQLLEVIRAHPQALVVNHELRNAWTARQYRSMYTIHRDQGMPESVYVHVYCGFNSFLLGFFEGKVSSMALKACLKKHGRAPDEWERIVMEAYTDRAFDCGIETLLRHIRHMAEPDSCNWRTPADPSTWTWSEDGDKALE